MLADWTQVWRRIIAIPEGMAMKVTRDDMALLMDCNRVGWDRLSPVTDAYIREAIDTWPMLSEYSISHDLLTNVYTFYRPTSAQTIQKQESD